MISLSAIRYHWCRPTWAVLLAVCVLLKSFTVSAAVAHDMDHGGTGSEMAALSDSPANQDPTGGDAFHRLLHSGQCCLQDAMAVFAANHPVWMAFPHATPAVVPTGRTSPTDWMPLRPPRLS